MKTNVKQVTSDFKSGNLGAVKLMLDSKIDANQLAMPHVGLIEKSMLTLAAEYGQIAIAQLLLEHKAQVDGGESKDCISTPLSYAVDTNDERIAQLLIFHQADVNCQQCSSDSSLLGKAMTNDNPTMVRLLLTARASLSHNNDHSDLMSLFKFAAKWEDCSIINQLKQRKVNFKDKISGEIPVAAAARLGAHQVLGTLIASGANVHAYSMDQNPLGRAVKKGFLNSINQLLQANAFNKLGRYRSSFLIEVVNTHDILVIQLFLQHNIDFNQYGNNKTTPLMQAACKGLFTIARLLVAASVKLDAQDLDKHTALDHAILQQHFPVVWLLYEQLLNSKKQPAGDDLLRLAVKVSSLMLVKYFLVKQAKPVPHRVKLFWPRWSDESKRAVLIAEAKRSIEYDWLPPLLYAGRLSILARNQSWFTCYRQQNVYFYLQVLIQQPHIKADNYQLTFTEFMQLPDLDGFAMAYALFAYKNRQAIDFTIEHLDQIRVYYLGYLQQTSAWTWQKKANLHDSAIQLVRVEWLRRGYKLWRKLSSFFSSILPTSKYINLLIFSYLDVLAANKIRPLVNMDSIIQQAYSSNKSSNKPSNKMDNVTLFRPLKKQRIDQADDPSTLKYPS